jgi:hypothetical protein
MSIIINTNKDGDKHYLDIKRYLYSFYLHNKCIIENYICNFHNKNDIVSIGNNMYIGNYSSSTNKQLLLNNNITDVLSIMSVFKPAFPNVFKYYHIKAYDDDFHDMTLNFLESNTYLNEVLNSNSKFKNKKIRKIFIYCETGKSLSVLVVLAYYIFLKQKKREEFKNKYALEYSIINKTKHSMSESQIIDNRRRIELYSNDKFVNLLQNNNNFYRISPDILLEILRILKKKDICINEKHLFQLHKLFF